ncbi:MAG: alpha/beta fold hydrolase [Burkholderiales bacterium]
MRRAFKFAAVVSVIGSAWLAGFIAWNWAPDRSVAELAARWAQPPSKFIALQNMQVHLRDEGPRNDPLPIVLLHGTSASLHTWDGWVAALKASRRVIRMDLPGFGLTGPFPDNDYRLPRYSRFVQELMDQLGVARFILVGNSFGGQIALQVTLDQPARISQLILVDSAGYPLAPTSVPIAFQLARLPFINRIANIALPRHIVENSVRNVYGDPERVTPELIDRYYELTLREGNRAALTARLEQVNVEEMAARIPQIKVPTLILWGGRDRLIPPDAAQRFARDIAGSELVMFDDLGHVPHEEAPDRTLTAMRKFLKTSLAGGAG